jgi:large subunit ribosomal protein L5
VTSTESAPTKVTPRLLEKYRRDVVPALRKQFGYRNVMMVPILERVVLNMGVGRAVENKGRLEHAARELAAIAGQRPVVTKARKSIAGFKLRENYPIGVAVTLRKARMWEFVDRFNSVVVPRIRDFRGFATKLDGSGNYSVGLAEQSVFPEIDLDKVEFVQGMNITFVTSATTDEEGFALLSALGLPFRK